MPVLSTRAFAMAKNAVVVTEDDLEQQFRDDKRFAVQLLDSEYREHIWRYIKSICRYFTDDDIHDVYQQARKRPAEHVEKNRSLGVVLASGEIRPDASGGGGG
jgi:hypothetical protein